ncbi:hypothetical protein [Paracandidimonas soli]|uniref:Uncharacterized protein n=1 Tax=Paracandidimonas soli TaxID=1917182 RepID=A0A4R3UTF4_9BURK|nr:hypothetical protein [Paracandidimonas soli]TCU95285.1 hypothetical protein EV686_108128 [Paracandidimonas soli]
MTDMITCLWFDHGKARDGGNDDDEEDRHRRDRSRAQGGQDSVSGVRLTEPTGLPCRGLPDRPTASTSGKLPESVVDYRSPIPACRYSEQ